jgi:osmotically-inducible protein OsmY
MLVSSSYLKKIRNLDLSVDSGAVTLRGEVGTARERRLVEGMVRLTPGVREVRNELTVVSP